VRGTPKRLRGALVALFFLSLGLNLAGVGWGLPARFHPDEKADVAARMVSERRLLPDSFINPSLPLMAMAPVIALQERLASAGFLWGRWSDPLLAGRVLSALAGAEAVVLLGFAVAVAHPEAAIVAPLLLTLAPGVVNLCHFATPEAWLLLGTAAVLLLAARHLRGSAPAWALGLALGLAASTKYTAAALAFPAVAAIWLRPRGPVERRDRVSWLLAAGALASLGLLLAGPAGTRLAASLRLPDVRLLHPESAQAFVSALAGAGLAGGVFGIVAALLVGHPRGRRWLGPLVRIEVIGAGLAALLGFLLGTPGAILAPGRFLSDLAFNAQTRHEYKGLVGSATSFGPYLGLLADALTIPLLVAALVGLALALARAWRGGRAALVVVLAAVAPYLLVASSGHRALRFVIPALPGAVWLAALALVEVRARRPRRLLCGAVAGRAAVGAILVVRLFFVDSRLRAERWMERNVPRGATVDVITNHEGYAPTVPEGRHLRLLRTLSREMAPPGRFAEAATRYPEDASEWLVLTAAFYERFLENPDQRPEQAHFFRDLLEGRRGFEIAARFRQEGWRRPRADEFLDPEIIILRKSPSIR
jgi:Dolichyl-phosphate-mannose-protein mannosyltransferase